MVTPAAGGRSAAGTISSQAIASAAKSTNPLDELMDLFSTASMQAPAQPVGQPASGMSMGRTSGLDDLMSPTPTGASQTTASRPPQQQQQQAAKADDDLLGLF
jgi:hypothetical protein